METEKWFVYMVRCRDGSLYTGIAKDVEARVAAHNEGKGAKYTRARRPVVLAYREEAADKGAALRRERAIKKMAAAKKRAMAGEVPLPGS